MPKEIFTRLESEVRTYCRSFPVVFEKAEGATLVDEDGRSYLDFLAGAGSLNYGHNPPELVRGVTEYLSSNGIAHSLDFHTTAKARFLEALEQHVLAPRQLPYRVQFTGPTGTNTVEAAIKLARKFTGRRSIVAFTGAFHGVTLGSLSVTAKRMPAGTGRTDVVRMPYDGFLGPEVDTIEYMETLFTKPGSGLEAPAAFIVETVQGEGGVNVARQGWLARLAELASRLGALLIVDDIQAGCGRTGTFFSFENAGIVPDIVCLSKSLSGLGLPLAIVLLHPDLDCWQPGEHNGTFRGNNLAFVSGAIALEHYWATPALLEHVETLSSRARERLEAIAESTGGRVRGRGLMLGLAFETGDAASELSRFAFDGGLVVETCGPGDEVLKLLPPLTITEADLDRGLDILTEAARSLGRCAA